MNVGERSEAVISTLGMKVSGSRRVSDSTEVREKKVYDAINRMNSGKSPGMDGVKV